MKFPMEQPADNIEQFPSPVDPKVQSAMVIAILRAQLLDAVGVLTAKLAGTDRKTEPTTYQTYRWLGAAMHSCEAALGELVKSTNLPMVKVDFEGMLYLQIPVLLADAEPRLLEAMKVFNLDQLPPGNPGEPEFERLLKIEIKINKAMGAAARELATLAHTLSLPAYELSLTEEARATAWRVARRTRLESLVGDLDKQLVEAREYLAALEAAKAKAIQQIDENDQLTFEDIDPAKAPQLGEEITEMAPKYPPQ